MATTVVTADRAKPVILAWFEAGDLDLLPIEYRRTPADVKKLLGGMTRVQRLVHLAARMTPDDVDDWRGRISRNNVRSYEETLGELARQHGCANAEGVLLNSSIRTDISDAAEWSSASIVNTYNYELARQIKKIAVDAPSANRHVYAHRLFYQDGSWGRRYAEAKAAQVAQFERWQSVNLATRHFYRYNNVGESKAEVRPYDTVCSICASYVADNPYKSMSELYSACDLPAHLGCPHYGYAFGGRLDRDGCADLWLGE